MECLSVLGKLRFVNFVGRCVKVGFTPDGLAAVHLSGNPINSVCQGRSVLFHADFSSETLAGPISSGLSKTGASSKLVNDQSDVAGSALPIAAIKSFSGVSVVALPATYSRMDDGQPS